MDTKHEESTRAADPNFANETSGFNLIPFASMAGGWLGPLLMFWLYVGAAPALRLPER